jgi:hypothetical protein
LGRIAIAGSLPAIQSAAAVGFAAVWATLHSGFALVEFLSALDPKPDRSFSSLLFPSLGIHLLSPTPDWMALDHKSKLSAG